MPARALAVPFLLVAATALAQDKNADPPKKADDPIAAQLAKDKETYTAACEKAKEGLLKSFDKHYEAVKSNKTLKVDVQVAQ